MTAQCLTSMPQTQGPQACKISTTTAQSHPDFQALTVEISIPTLTNGQEARQKLNREILEQTYYKPSKPNNIYRLFHPKQKKYFLLNTSWNFLQTDHMFEHKASLIRYKKTERTSCFISDHHRLTPDIKNRNNRKFTNSWILNTSLLDGNGSRQK